MDALQISGIKLVEVAEFGALAPEPERDFLLPREFLPQAGQLRPER